MKVKASAFADVIGLIESRTLMVEHDELFYKDTIKRCLHYQLNQPLMITNQSPTAMIGNETTQQAQANVGRGEKISIPMVGSNLEINTKILRQMVSLIGRRMAVRWRDTHTGQEPSKRRVQFQARSTKIHITSVIAQ